MPDLNSVLGVRRAANYLAEHRLVFSPIYVLNKFDKTQMLHVEILDSFKRQLSDSPILTLRRTDETSEALAEGLTVIDYPGKSGIIEDCLHLAGIIQDQADQNRHLKRA